MSDKNSTHIIVAVLFVVMLSSSCHSTDTSNKKIIQDTTRGDTDFSSLLEKISTNDLPIDHLYITKDSKEILNLSFFPNSVNTPHALESVTKSITAMAYGKAMEEDLLPPTEVPISFQYKNDLFFDPVQPVTTGHLLSMSAGWAPADINTMSCFHYDSGLQHLAQTIPQYKHGEQFLYSEVNPFILSVMLTVRSGVRLETYVREHFFSPLGITKFIWTDPILDYTQGGDGLYMSAKDSGKIGALLLENGVLADKTLLSKEWISQMFTARIAITDNLEYGYYWRILESRYLFGWGDGGQFLFLDPIDKICIVLFSSFSIYSEFLAQDLILQEILPVILYSKDHTLHFFRFRM